LVKKQEKSTYVQRSRGKLWRDKNLLWELRDEDMRQKEPVPTQVRRSMKAVVGGQKISVAATRFAWADIVAIAGIGTILSKGAPHVSPGSELRCMSKTSGWHDQGKEHDEDGDKIHRR
jgi:hypothetical protein